MCNVKTELESGDVDTAVGWGVFAVGGAVVAAGFALKNAGVVVTVGTGGLGVEIGGPLIVAGFVVEAIGLLVVAVCNDDELEEWLVKSMFGAKPLLVSQPAFKNMDEKGTEYPTKEKNRIRWSLKRPCRTAVPFHC